MSAYLDTRDLEKRLEELNDELSELEETLEDARAALRENEDDSQEEDLKEAVELADNDLINWHESNDEEHKALLDLADEINLSDGETMIPDDEFSAYVEELARDCGYISRDFPNWIEIDWDKTAENVKQDYTEVEYLGETYQVRCC